MTNSESAINCLLDVVLACAGKERRAKMDDWAARYPTNTLDVARVVADLADLSLSRPLPSTLHFSAQERLTKYEISKIFASAHAPPLELDEAGWLIRDDAGPQPGDTIRPKDCHLSNVRYPSPARASIADKFSSHPGITACSRSARDRLQHRCDVRPMGAGFCQSATEESLRLGRGRRPYSRLG